MLSQIHRVSFLNHYKMWCFSCVFMISMTIGHAKVNKQKVNKKKTSQSANKKTKKQNSSQPKDQSNSQNQSNPQKSQTNTTTTPQVKQPDIIQFVVTDLHRGVTRDQRILRSPRVVTLQVLSPRRPLSESLWRGKSLEVFRLVPLDTPDISLAELFENSEATDGEMNLPQLPPVRVSVGSLVIKSVHGMTLQAVVQNDDLSSRDLFTDLGEAKVVMIGDLAERPKPKAPIVKKAPRRVRKAPKNTLYERKEMRWQM